MPMVDIAEQAGHGRSEDVVRVLPNAVVLLDGATSLRPTERTGGWYATKLADAVVQRLPREDDLADLLADSIAEVSGTYGLRPGDSPSSTVAVLRWDEESAEGLVLADSPIVMFTTSGELPITDDRLANLRSAGGGYRERLRSGGGFGAEHLTELTAAVDATRRSRNVDGGFWVAEAMPEAAYQATRLRVTRADLLAALLASDGVSCGVDDYGVYPDWSTMLAEAVSAGPHSVLETVRAAERSDPDGRRWPRPKRHDDQALAVVRFAGEDQR